MKEVYYINLEKERAKKWGIEISCSLGDCTSEHRNTIEPKFELQNKPVFQFMEKRYGKNWETKFNREVDSL